MSWPLPANERTVVSSAKVDGPSTPEIIKWLGGDIQKFQIGVVEDVIREEVGAGRFTTTPTVITDGVLRRDYHAVKAFGKVELVETPVMPDVVRWALALLVRLAPVRSGRYRDSNVVLLNGKGITEQNIATLAAARPGDRVQIVNVQPYARKIEGQRAKRRKGWKGRRGLSRQAPGGVYRKAYAMIQQRWGRAVFVDYRLERLDIGGVELRSSAATLRSKKGFYTYPVLQFYLKPSL